MTTGGRVPGGPVTLRARLRHALTLAGVVLGVLVLCALVSIVQVVRAQQQVTNVYYGAIMEVSEGYVLVLDAERAVGDYAAVGDPALLGPYRELERRAGETAALVEDLAQEAELIAARTRAVEAARAWIEGHAQPTVAAVEAGGPAAVTAADLGRGDALFVDLRSTIDEYLGEIQQHREAALDRLRLWTRLLVASAAALLLGAVVVGAALWAVLGRMVTQPLAALAADARRVSSGAIDHPVRSTGPGEIAALAADVETMRRVLVRQVEQAAEASTELSEAHRRLTDQAEELQRSNRDLEQFAYVASHDLQEPLRKVASFTQLLQKRYGGQLDERADQYIEFAVDGAKRMQRLIQDLLGFSRVGRMTGEATDVDLAGALAEATSNLEEAIAEAGATVTHDALPVVRGERPLLVQLLQNLVGNAVKFHDPARAPRVHLTARRDGERWEVECRDNGIGIDEQYAERVFVIFQRLHAKDAYEGTGIGLSLCKKIVEHHGGQIWIAPVAEGPGTSIRFTLPAVPDDVVDPDRDPADERRVTAGAPAAGPTAPDAAVDVDPAGRPHP